MTGYGDDSGFNEWLAGNGLSLPKGAPSVEALRHLGSAYVDAAYAHKLPCSRKAGGFQQPLEWPRSGHNANGLSVPDDFVPPAWIEAAYRAGYLSAITPGWATSGTDPGRLAQREKVDVIERTFFAPGEVAGSGNVAPGMPFDAVINALVLPWLCPTGRGLNDLFRVV